MSGSDIDADVRKLSKVIENKPEPVAKPAFIIICGLPGVGKSYFSRKLSEHIPSVIIESDALRKKLFAYPKYTAEENKRLFNACHRLSEELLHKGITVILDATNLVERHREYLYRIAERTRSKLLIISVTAPPDVIKERFQRREMKMDAQDSSEADWNVHRRMKTRAGRIGRNFITVDTSEDIEQGIRKIIHELKR